ncbi:MAG: hypothetical protein QOE79_873 [Sphingomonadales bacterium]|jgi:hypothetical protein|nr:hypothetical protein [Sphingomonadales bacterium]
MAAATTAAGEAERPRWRLPERLPDFGRRSLILFRLLWFAAFLLALAGPVAGTWYRVKDASRNSALIPGSRAGFAVSDKDLTRIRFPVGPEAARLGLRRGDHIVAIDGIAVSPVVPMPGTPAAVKAKVTDADQALFGDLLYGEESRDVALTLRGPDGGVRDVHVTTGEQHIEAGAAALGIPDPVLSFADLIHLITYPFLLASAWVLYRRKERDVISSVVSLAILLTMASEQPSASFLELVAHVPAWLHRSLYDLGNVCLLAGIMLFPHGRLSPRPVLGIVATLPILFFLGGDLYRTVFMLYMAASVLTLVWRLRHTKGDERQQLKWALFGFSGYALFLATSLVSDMWKLEAASLGGRLGLELLAGFSFGFAFLLLQLGLFVALMRYRLYDAESVITRSASIAVIALIVATLFEMVIEALKQFVQNEFGQNSGSTGPVAAAALATILIKPIYERVEAWTERRFHRRLVELREDLPDCLRDLRHVAALPELLDQVFDRVEAGVRPIRVAAVIGGRVVGARGANGEEVLAWIASAGLDPACEIHFEGSDAFFPIRVPLRLDDGSCLGFLLIGPRPDCSSIGSAELAALKDVAGPIARALWITLSREGREHEVAAALAAQQRQIDALSARLAIDRPGAAA